ncbi:STAS domain-containing protein [candidate division KSB1 bacterium]|nr:STAS domain-containing protein [candidate division KSB1 bacterium]
MANEHICIVNSKLIISMEMQHYLESKGYELTVFGGFDEFVSDFRTLRKPDVIVFEIISLTPELMENVQELKKLPELNGIPNIAILNMATKNLVLFLAQMGIKEIMVKPFVKEALLEKIDKAIAPVESGSFRIRPGQSPDEYTIVELLAQLDAKNSNNIDQLLAGLIQKGNRKVAFDFQRVSHVDSSGIGILIVCKKRMEIAGGEFKLGNLSEHVLDVLKSLRLDSILDIVDDVHELSVGLAKPMNNTSENEPADDEIVVDSEKQSNELDELTDENKPEQQPEVITINENQ